MAQAQRVDVGTEVQAPAVASTAAPVTVLPLDLTDAVWKQLIGVSLYRTVDERDMRKPRKMRITDGQVATVDILLAMDDAMVERGQLQARIAELRDHADAHMPTEEAAACLAAAWRACRYEWTPALPGARCVFTGETSVTHRDGTESVQTITFYGNRSGVAGSSVRVDESFAMGRMRPWGEWIDAVLVVGSAVEWMDQLVVAWLDAQPLEAWLRNNPHAVERPTTLAPWTTIDGSRMRLLHACEPIMRKRRVLHLASRVLLHHLST